LCNCSAYSKGELAKKTVVASFTARYKGKKIDKTGASFKKPENYILNYFQ